MDNILEQKTFVERYFGLEEMFQKGKKEGEEHDAQDPKYKWDIPDTIKEEMESI